MNYRLVIFVVVFILIVHPLNAQKEHYKKIFENDSLARFQIGVSMNRFLEFVGLLGNKIVEKTSASINQTPYTPIKKGELYPFSYGWGLHFKHPKAKILNRYGVNFNWTYLSGSVYIGRAFHPFKKLKRLYFGFDGFFSKSINYALKVSNWYDKRTIYGGSLFIGYGWSINHKLMVYTETNIFAGYRSINYRLPYFYNIKEPIVYTYKLVSLELIYNLK